MLLMLRFATVVLALGLATQAHVRLQAQATHASKRAAVGDAEAGQEIFQRRCIMCHSLSPGVKIVGPSLYSEMRGPHPHTAAAVREIIVNGKGQMPAMGKQLTDQEIADVLAYLRKQ